MKNQLWILQSLICKQDCVKWNFLSHWLHSTVQSRVASSTWWEIGRGVKILGVAPVHAITSSTKAEETSSCWGNTLGFPQNNMVKSQFWVSPSAAPLYSDTTSSSVLEVNCDPPTAAPFTLPPFIQSIISEKWGGGCWQVDQQWKMGGGIQARKSSYIVLGGGGRRMIPLGHN